MLGLTQPTPLPGGGVVPPALPKYYRVKASSMNLLELIEHVCADANHDFTVELLPDLESAGDTFEDRSLDGIIKIKVIDKRVKPDTTIIAGEIRKAEWSLGLIGAINPNVNPPAPFPAARTHQWYNRITTYDMGKDFATEPAGKMIVGGPETRVVGADIRLGVDRIDFTKCACIKDENVENQVAGFPWTAADTQTQCEALGDNYAWRCFRRPTEFDGVQLPGAYRLDNKGTWGLIETSVTDNNNVYSPGDWRRIMDPLFFGGFFNDTNLDYDDTDRFHIQNATNLTPIDASVNLLSGAGTGGREVWSVWGKLRHSPLGNSHDGLDGQYVTTDVDDEYDYCNAETGQCRFIRGYSNTMLNGDGEVVTQGGEWQTPEYYASNAGLDLIFNKNFRQDYRIDLFPCWGFMNVYENETVGGSIGKEDVVIADKAVPIKGDFDEMNPYRDFSPYTGIGSNHMYVLTGPLDPSPGVAAGGLGKRSRGGPGGGPGTDQYDSVEWCVDKLLEEGVGGQGGLAALTMAEYTRDYVAPCNPQSGSRIFGYRRSKDLHNNTGNGPRVADKSLDELLEGGSISDDDYVTIVTLSPTDEDTWDFATSSYRKNPSAVTVLHKNNNGMYPSPPAATIPIDLREAGIQDLKHGVGGVHLATITELRHALISKNNWEDYLRSFDPQYADDLGVGDTGVGNSSRTHENAPIITEADGTNPTVASLFEGKSSILPNSKNYGALLTSAVNVDENDTDKRRTKVYEITKGIADGYYGKKFLMPLPYDPQRLSEFEKRTYVDDEQKIAAYKVTNKWEIAQAGWVDTETKAAMANTAGGEDAAALMEEQRFIKYPTDSRFFNSDGMLEPYVVFPHKVWVDVKKTREEWKLALPGAGAIQKNRVEKKNLGTANACPPCDGRGWEWNKDSNHNYQNGAQTPYGVAKVEFQSEVECRKYYQGETKAKTLAPKNNGKELDEGLPEFPGCLKDGSNQESNCAELDPEVRIIMGDGTDGALTTEVDQRKSMCNWGWIRADKEYVQLSFEPLDFSEFDRNDYYIENTRDDAPAGDYCTNAKYSDKATCEDDADDRKTPDGLPLDINPGRWITENSYLTRVFVKASVDPKTYWLPSDIYNTKGVGEGGSAEVHTGKNSDQLRPYGLISLNGVVRYPKDTIIGSAGANLGGAHFHLHLKTKNAYFGSRKSFSEMAPAAFKPWEAAIPQQSSVNSWGPWSNGEFYGAAQFEEDSSLSPEQYGSLHGMNLAGDARAGLDGIDYQEQESGSVTVTGLPESPLAGRLFAGGPYITNISVDIGTGGITTGYRMETYKRHIGRDTMNETQRANRIRKAQNAREKEARDNRRFRNRPKKD